MNASRVKRTPASSASLVNEARNFSSSVTSASSCCVTCGTLSQARFRCAPEIVGGLYFAGIDVVSLANNHIMDYMEPGMIQTQNILNEAGILHSGAGMDSYQAYLPAFLSAKGQTLAFIASSDRTGQYNNYQPVKTIHQALVCIHKERKSMTDQSFLVSCPLLKFLTCICPFLFM